VPAPRITDAERKRVLDIGEKWGMKIGPNRPGGKTAAKSAPKTASKTAPKVVVEDEGPDTVYTKFGTWVKGTIINETVEELTLKVTDGKLSFKRADLIRIIRGVKTDATAAPADVVIAYKNEKSGVNFRVTGGIWKEYKKPALKSAHEVAFLGLDGAIEIAFESRSTDKSKDLEAFADEIRTAFEEKYTGLSDYQEKSVEMGRLPAKLAAFYVQREGKTFYEAYCFCLWQDSAFILSVACPGSYAEQYGSVFDETVKSFAIAGAKEEALAAESERRLASPLKFNAKELGVAFGLPRKGWTRINTTDAGVAAAFGNRETDAKVEFSTALLKPNETLDDYVKSKTGVKAVNEDTAQRMILDGEKAYLTSGDILGDASIGENNKTRVEVFAERGGRIYAFVMLVRLDEYEFIISDFNAMLASVKFSR
jgi:hypothetical protein